MPDIWESLLVAYLHDPPDKPLSIPDHVSRALRYASTAVGRTVVREELERDADMLASKCERIIFPTAGEDGVRAVGVADGSILVRHPLSAAETNLPVPAIDELAINAAIEKVVNGVEDPRRRFLAIWRLLPGELEKVHPSYARLPAETRIPDHTIWNHLDITAGWKAATEGNRGAALLLFNLGPVQRFIETARTTRDLWSGSMILSWLCFQGLLPILDELGPTAIVFPSLRGIPFVDRYLRQKVRYISEPSIEMAKSPCLPNRFLSLVPWGSDDGRLAREIAMKCERSVRDGWRRMCQSVRERLSEEFEQFPYCDNWDSFWDEQTQGFFDITTAILPLNETGDEAIAKVWGCADLKNVRSDIEEIRNLSNSIPESDKPPYVAKYGNSAGLWQLQVDLCNRMSAARRTMRNFPKVSQKSGKIPAKCTLMGNFEQLGPADRAHANEFWVRVRTRSYDGQRIGKRERLCAVSLVKRLCPRWFLSEELGLDHDELRFPDTATVAAKLWLDNHPEIKWKEVSNWSGQWLHRESQDAKDEDEDETPPKAVWMQVQDARKGEKPPAYYAILMMDGDQMGQWLQGEKTPALRDAMHAKMRAYFEKSATSQKGLDRKRPVGPALHAAISEALANFSVNIVPRIVKEHGGTLIYSGGDDVLAMLPVQKALGCARRLREAFSGSPSGNNGAPDGFYRLDGRDLLTMGTTATASAGLAVVHYKEDLRAALTVARNAEKAAKNAGRDRLSLAVCRRSGERNTVTCHWNFVSTVDEWVTSFLEDGVSDRWSYKLRADLEVLRSLDVSAMKSEIRRQIRRSEKKTRNEFEDTLPGALESLMALEAGHAESKGKVLEQFVSLCQSASFLARGRDS